MADTKRALIFGGAGFIGGHLARRLVELGYTDVVSADIVEPGRPVDGVRYLTHDVREPIPPDLLPEPPDEVYNLAAVHRTPGHPDHEYFDTNVNGARNVCAYCREAGVKRLLFTSSIAVYGPGEEALDEVSPTTPVTAYGKSKLEAETIHRAWNDEEPGRRLVIVRPAAIFGPGEKGNFTRLAKALRNRAFIYPGRRDTIKACGYVEEIVESFMFTLGMDRKAFLYNFCYPETYTIENICAAFHDVAGYPRPPLIMPLAPLLAVALVFEGLNRIGLRNGIHRDRVRKLVVSTRIVPKALGLAGYEYRTDLRAGLQRWRDREPRGRFV